MEKPHFIQRGQCTLAPGESGRQRHGPCGCLRKSQTTADAETVSRGADRRAGQNPKNKRKAAGTCGRRCRWESITTQTAAQTWASLWCDGKVMQGSAGGNQGSPDV